MSALWDYVHKLDHARPETQKDFIDTRMRRDGQVTRAVDRGICGSQGGRGQFNFE